MPGSDGGLKCLPLSAKALFAHGNDHCMTTPRIGVRRDEGRRRAISAVGLMAAD
jgi:hypothetical protein